MRRKQKRLLQIAFLLIVAFLLLPNVGLWSSSLERLLDSSSADGPRLSHTQVPQISLRNTELSLSLRYKLL